jgi:LacI family transcriptional regulator
MPRRIKISDVARQSGVSITTVSLVLNNKPGLSEETRARVLEAASQLGYQGRSSQAKAPPLATVGMVVKIDPDITPQANPFYSKVIVGIEDACRRKGINLLFATLPVDENNRPVEVPQFLHNDMVNGLLMVGTFVDETFEFIPGQQGATPIILVDGYSNCEIYDSVVSDNFRAAYQAVEVLIQKGHRHIGLAGSDIHCYPSLKERRNGYLRALKENEITETYIANFNINTTHGYHETTALLKEHPQITALFCVNDDAASAAIKAAQALGRNVPGDLSVIGYDDTYIAQNTHPALTTVHVDTVALGRCAVNLLALRLEHPNTARMSLTVHSTLVERESVALPPSHAVPSEI